MHNSSSKIFEDLRKDSNFRKTFLEKLVLYHSSRNIHYVSFENERISICYIAVNLYNFLSYFISLTIFLLMPSNQCLSLKRFYKYVLHSSNTFIFQKLPRMKYGQDLWQCKVPTKFHDFKFHYFLNCLFCFWNYFNYVFKIC